MVVNQELVDYIKESLRYGKNPSEIKYDLINEGWEDTDIDAGLYEAQGSENKQPIQNYQEPTPQYQQQPQNYQQSAQNQSSGYFQQPAPIQQPSQPAQPVQTVSSGGSIFGLIFSMVSVVMLMLDVTILKSRTWIDIFSSLSVVDTSTLGMELVVLLIVFAAGIAMGGLISFRKKSLLGGLLVLVLSLLSMLTFSGLLSGLVGLVAGFIILIGK